ncbi:TPA: DUF551 domain-containing protein [Citrobacter freundii]|nr:DUF551 domain-containing protein [Citrobacter freundii]
MTTNHPAHGPVSLDRLHQISEILSKAAAQSDGGNLGYAMADAVKVIDGAIASFGAEPVGTFRKGPCGYYPSFHEDAVPLYAAPPAPVVPDEKPMPEASKMYAIDAVAAIAEVRGWNACRDAMLQAGNSPVTTDGWIPVSERMPEGMKTVITSNGFDIGQGWWDGECWKSFDCHDVVPGKVTHWMQLPNPPKE